MSKNYEICTPAKLIPRSNFTKFSKSLKIGDRVTLLKTDLSLVGTRGPLGVHIFIFLKWGFYTQLSFSFHC
jgi:hypothetical protein